MNSDQELKHSA